MLFNLIVGRSAEEVQFDLPSSRMYDDSMTDLDGVTTRPTIVMPEHQNNRDQFGHFVSITRLSERGGDVYFRVVADPDMEPMPMAFFLENFTDFDQGSDVRWAFNKTCLKVIEGNPYELFLRWQTRHKTNSNGSSLLKFKSPARIDHNLLSVMMPFKEMFDDVYTCIQEVGGQLSLDVKRADDIFSNQPVIDDVVALIDDASIIVCDLSRKNANVFYEAGIAHTLGRNVILIANDINDIPFDLRYIRVIDYDATTRQGQEALKDRLTKTINTIRGS